MDKLKVGDLVTKNAGDYIFSGRIVAIFTKMSGNVRVVVENQDGVLHIFSELNLQKQTK